jgi:hypothetical protein
MRRWLLVGSLATLGGIVGVSLTLAAGTVCVVGDVGFCGLNFLIWNLSVPVAIALSAATGVVVGGFVGLSLLLVFRRLRATSAGSASEGSPASLP